MAKLLLDPIGLLLAGEVRAHFVNALGYVIAILSGFIGVSGSDVTEFCIELL